MAIIYANIGSNLGEREALISQALECIGNKFKYYCISRWVESEPWGFDSIHRFLNVGVAFRSELPGDEILETLQDIEKEISKVAHRTENGDYKDREIDIDIMAIDEKIIRTPDLEVPHRHLAERLFFLEPMLDLNPDWKDPRDGRSLGNIIKAIQS